MNEDDLLHNLLLTETGERVYVEKVDAARDEFPARVRALYLSGPRKGERDVLAAHTLQPIEK